MWIFPGRVDKGDSHDGLNIVQDRFLHEGLSWREALCRMWNGSTLSRFCRRYASPIVVSLSIIAASWMVFAGSPELVRLGVLNESKTVPDSAQMIDNAIIRAHPQSAGAKAHTAIGGNRLPGGRGFKKRILAARKVALRPRSISSSTGGACR